MVLAGDQLPMWWILNWDKLQSLCGRPMAITSFLRRWAKIHNKIVSEAEMTQLPLFYPPNLKPNVSPLTTQSSSNWTKDCTQTLIVKLKRTNARVVVY